MLSLLTVNRYLLTLRFSGDRPTFTIDRPFGDDLTKSIEHPSS